MQIKGAVIGGATALALVGGAWAAAAIANASNPPDPEPVVTVEPTKTEAPEPVVTTPATEPVVETPAPEPAAPAPAPAVEAPVTEPAPDPAPTFDPGGQVSEGAVTPLGDGSQSVVLYPPNPPEG